MCGHCHRNSEKLMSKNKLSKETSQQTGLEGYNDLLRDIQSILQKGLSKAYQAVDNLKVQTYWQVGERVVREELAHKDRADYGKYLIDKLSVDLGFRRDELFRIIQFYRTYPIVVTVSRQLSWSHYLELITIKKDEERQFYEAQSIRNSWSVRELRDKIKNNEYKTAKKEGQVITKVSIPLPSPDEVFKNTYNWDFIELDEKHSEKELEDGVLNNIQKVLLEFGKGFAFVARQQRVLIAGQWEKIDLLFYHILLKCYVIVDLKARDLQRGDIEQITRYLTFYREQKIEGDRDPIALIICRGHKRLDVYYSAGKNRDDIFVAEYKTKLPSEEEIKRKLGKIAK